MNVYWGILIFNVRASLLAAILFAGGGAASAAQISRSITPAQAANTPPPLAPPSITSQPSNRTAAVGQPATFTVAASGSAPLAYQWKRNGIAIAGATSPEFTLPAVTAADSGAQFSVTVSNAAGAVTSRVATLSVSAGPPQRTPEHISRFLSNSYAGVQIGSINYAFSNAQLQPGFQAQSVSTPHAAARVIIFGHEFGPYFSVQLSEMRPVLWIAYHNVNGDMQDSSVWMNVGGLTARGRLPLRGKWSLIGEGGLGLVTRHGFTFDSEAAMRGIAYGTFLYGGGIDYRLNEKWDLLSELIVAPGNAGDKQPATVFFAGGFNYTLRRVPSQPAGQESPDAPIWPRNIVQIGYATNAVGYGVNDFFTDRHKFPIFWGGLINAANGVSVEYRRNLYHTRRWFALDAGASVSTWKSNRDGSRFYTAALYPVLRLPIVRTNPWEFYFSYSLVGPGVISRTNIDGLEVGKNFTFQDYLGFGMYFGRSRRITAETRIQHYSNGNIFPENSGVTIPLAFYLGTSF